MRTEILGGIGIPFMLIKGHVILINGQEAACRGILKQSITFMSLDYLCSYFKELLQLEGSHSLLSSWAQGQRK